MGGGSGGGEGVESRSVPRWKRTFFDVSVLMMTFGELGPAPGLTGGLEGLGEVSREDSERTR